MPEELFRRLRTSEEDPMVDVLIKQGSLEVIVPDPQMLWCFAHDAGVVDVFARCCVANITPAALCNIRWGFVVDMGGPVNA